MEKKNTWETYSSKQLKELEKINAQYRDFLDNGKTERECIDTIVNTIEKSGYRELESLIKEGTALKTGDKVYSVWMNKSIAMFQIGRKPMTEGMNILGAHIDSPRLDVSGHTLLRWCEEVPVGDYSPGNPWCDREKRRYLCRDQYRRERG